MLHLDDYRVTHIYRRIAGEWYLVHRHADFPPSDQRAQGLHLVGRDEELDERGAGAMGTVR